MALRRRWPVIHTYVVYELFGIPRDRWLSCLPWQTTANYQEQVQIRRFLSPHPGPPPEGEGKRMQRR
jgi:hypothetical protein